jgi:hypothetical protein
MRAIEESIEKFAPSSKRVDDRETGQAGRKSFPVSMKLCNTYGEEASACPTNKQAERLERDAISPK